MKNIIILLSFIFFTASCGKESIVENPTTSDVKFIMFDKTASTKVTEHLCKCIDMYALIYYKNELVGQKKFEAGYSGTMFEGLRAGVTYNIIIYTINKSDRVPLPTNVNTLGNARVTMNENVDFMYLRKDILLKPGTNVISIKLEKLFAELVFTKKNVYATVSNNLNNYRVNLDDGSISNTTVGSRTFNTKDTIIINNLNVVSNIRMSDNFVTIKEKFKKGGRYLITKY